MTDCDKMAGHIIMEESHAFEMLGRTSFLMIVHRGSPLSVKAFAMLSSSAFQCCPQTSRSRAPMNLAVCIRSSLDPSTFLQA